MRVGYGRVSTRDQNPDGQRDALVAAGCDEIYVDKASGKLASRPQLDRALLIAARAGDQLVITKLDRLGRSLEHLIALSTQLPDAGRGPRRARPGHRHVDRGRTDVLSDPRPIAEFEHALMSERTRDGLDAARARGRTGGQKPKLTARQAKIAQDMYDELGPDGHRAHTVQQIADEFGVTRPTIYRHLQRPSA